MNEPKFLKWWEDFKTGYVKDTPEDRIWRDKATCEIGWNARDVEISRLTNALQIAEEALKFIGEACPSPVGIAYRALEAVAKAKGEV